MLKLDRDNAHDGTFSTRRLVSKVLYGQSKVHNCPSDRVDNIFLFCPLNVFFHHHFLLGLK
jgi:hypothetical protein